VAKDALITSNKVRKEKTGGERTHILAPVETREEEGGTLVVVLGKKSARGIGSIHYAPSGLIKEKNLPAQGPFSVKGTGGPSHTKLGGKKRKFAPAAFLRARTREGGGRNHCGRKKRNATLGGRTT